MHPLVVAYVVVVLAHLVLHHATRGVIQPFTPVPATNTKEDSPPSTQDMIQRNVREMYAFVYDNLDKESADAALDKFFATPVPDPEAAPSKTPSSWPPAPTDDMSRIDAIYESRRMSPKPPPTTATAVATHQFGVVAEYDADSHQDGNLSGFDAASSPFAMIE